MIETFTALLFAHVLSDFVLQTDWIHRNKRHFGVMLLHGALVLVASLAALGQVAALPVLALAAAHVAIDCAKTYVNFKGLTAFLADQALHLLVIIAVAFHAPALWATGAWADTPTLLPLMALLAGLITTLVAGQYAVGLLMRSHGVLIQQRGLRNGGRQIGLIERGLIFFFVMANQPLGVGFLITAKSILRFGTAARDQKTAEYVIIGTLASFAWAFLVSEATRAWMDLLPPLEIAVWLA